MASCFSAFTDREYASSLCCFPFCLSVRDRAFLGQQLARALAGMEELRAVCVGCLSCVFRARDLFAIPLCYVRVRDMQVCLCVCAFHRNAVLVCCAYMA